MSIENHVKKVHAPPPTGGVKKSMRRPRPGCPGDLPVNFDHFLSAFHAQTWSLHLDSTKWAILSSNIDQKNRKNDVSTKICNACQTCMDKDWDGQGGTISEKHKKDWSSCMGVCEKCTNYGSLSTGVFNYVSDAAAI